MAAPPVAGAARQRLYISYKYYQMKGEISSAEDIARREETDI